LGRHLGEQGHGLIYGGGRVGLMGAVADAALATGAPVTGVITKQLVDLEVAHDDLTKIEVLPTMHARKARMAELADGVIVLPGGFGTLDETFEILTWIQLGLVSAAAVCIDVNDYFQPLFDFIGRAVDSGFVANHHGTLLQRVADPAAAVAAATGPAPGYQPKWVD